MNVAIIPARGGSKRIPRKNIKEFCGKPMIAWTIQIAIKSNLFDQIIISTDDNEIAETAQLYGAKILFMRPENLADDHTPTVPVIAHAINACLILGMNIKYACCIYPCAPFIQIDDLHTALHLLESGNHNYVYPICRYPHPTQRAIRLVGNNSIEFIYPENEMARTQDLEDLYHDTGQFYFGKATSWTQLIPMHTAGAGMPIPSWRIVDIDTEDDWKRAELIFKTFTHQNR